MTSKTIESEAGHAEFTGLESGKEYFFRVRAVNSAGNSGWSDVASVVIGKEPSAPTTWSSTTTAMVGESLILYWIHNSQDGSYEKHAQLELTLTVELRHRRFKIRNPTMIKEKQVHIPSILECIQKAQP